MAKPYRFVALKTAEDPGRDGFAAEGSIGHITHYYSCTGRELKRKKSRKLRRMSMEKTRSTKRFSVLCVGFAMAGLLLLVLYMFWSSPMPKPV